MLRKIILFAVKNRLLVIIGLVVVIIAGIITLPTLNLDAFPDVTNIQVEINTEAEGLASEEMEQLVTFPIESVMYTLPDVEEVRSLSRTGLSIVTVVFKDTVDIYKARQLVFQRLQEAEKNIPKNTGKPSIGPNTSGLGYVYQYFLKSNDSKKYDIRTLRSYNDWLVKLLFLPIDGITDILSFGGEVKQYQVLVKPSMLMKYDLCMDDIVKSIEKNNSNAGGWYLDHGDEQLIIRGVGRLKPGNQALTDLADIPIKEKNGVVVHLRDVAKIAYGTEIRQGAVTMTLRDKNGTAKPLGEIVTGIILKRTGANTEKTINSIKKKIPIIQRALPEGVTLETIYDQSYLIKHAVHTVIKALIIAFILIFIMLLLFLLNLRATFLVLLSIPISIGFALTIIAYFNMSANLMSLGGLAVAIGMLVDGSICMIENILKHISDLNYNIYNEGHADSEALELRVEEATFEVARPVLFATLIVIVVFIPILTLEGMEGKLFYPMTMSIVIAMIASLIVAIIVIPALATYLYHREVKNRKNFILDPINKLYCFCLNKTLRYSKTIIISAVILFIASISLIPFLGTEFFPELEEGALNIRVTLGPSTSLKTSLKVAKKMEAALLTFPEVTYASARIGRAELGGCPEVVSNIEIIVGLKPASEWTSVDNRKQLQRKMEKKMSVYPGLLFSFSQPIATRVDELLSGVKAELAVKLFGPDFKVLAEKGKKIEKIIKTVKGTEDVAMEPITGEAQLVIAPIREKLKRYDIGIDQIMSLISNSIGGMSAGQIINGNERYDIYVRLEKKYRDNIQAIQNLLLRSPNGRIVKLRDVADVEIKTGPPQIKRDDVQRRVVVEANIGERDMGSVVAEIKRKIASEVKLPPGYTVVYGGQFKNQDRAQKRLMIVIPISLVLIFILLYFAFNSVIQSFIIMVNVPMAVIGGIIALFISGEYLSVPSSIGFIALCGIAVLDGVVMVNAINQNIKGGTEPGKSIYKGAASRLNPVLLTTVTSALGLIPLLFSRGIGAEIQKPLAVVVVGGLFSSTLLTLFVLPSLYKIFLPLIANSKKTNEI
ncbi:MAG TPA: CusA/CzcA family heavy metal efflux RND transporter [Victivallales bacterium]|nr:CusA/CzcA family heavy metal efflux RND transporter [Victivallales bacterium]